MITFNFVIFGFTSNLAQLKIIPALYDLEEKGLLSSDTKIIGIGRKDINISDFVSNVLSTQNRHHLHKIKNNIKQNLINKIIYLREDFEKEDENLYQKLKGFSGNTLYYLATYPDLYHKIFQSLKNNNLNKSSSGWVRIMIEKPISRQVNNMVTNYFSGDQVYRVDHYLGKESLRKIFGSSIDIAKIKKVEAVISENFGIGKRGVYYDSIGALVDMGQNHLLQMVASVFSKSANHTDREKVLENLDTSGEIFFGQYDGYLDEENVRKDSNVDTFFMLKTTYKNIPVYISSGKYLGKNQAMVKVYFNDLTQKEFLISPTKISEEFDPYERLILDCVNGDQTFFNSEKEVNLSWNFIDEYLRKREKLFIYKKGSDLFDRMSAKLST